MVRSWLNPIFKQLSKHTTYNNIGYSDCISVKATKFYQYTSALATNHKLVLANKTIWTIFKHIPTPWRNEQNYTTWPHALVALWPLNLSQLLNEDYQTTLFMLLLQNKYFNFFYKNLFEHPRPILHNFTVYIQSYVPTCVYCL